MYWIFHNFFDTHRYFVCFISIYSLWRGQNESWLWIIYTCWYCTYKMGNARCAKRSKFTSTTFRYGTFICRGSQWHHHQLQRRKELSGIKRTHIWIGNWYGNYCKACLSFVSWTSKLLIPWIGWTSYSTVGEYPIFSGFKQNGANKSANQIYYIKGSFLCLNKSLDLHHRSNISILMFTVFTFQFPFSTIRIPMLFFLICIVILQFCHI